MLVWKRFWVLCCLVGLGCFGAHCSSKSDSNNNASSNTNNTASDNTNNSNTAPPKPVSQEKPAMLILEFVDSSRTTPAVKGEPGAEVRTFKVWVWTGPMKEEQAGTFPLLMVAHGLGGHPDKLRTFAAYLANQGITVVAPRFPMTNRDAPAGAPAGMFDLEQQPSDLTFVLDKILAKGKEEGSPLYRRFDPSKIVALGHSLGGATVLGWTRFACCTEERVMASVLVAPATNLNAVVFKESEPSKEGPPTLIIHGKKDEVLQYDVSVNMYEAFTGTVFFLGLQEAQHSDLLESNQDPTIAVQMATQNAVAAFIKEFAYGDRGATQAALELLGKAGEVVKSKK